MTIHILVFGLPGSGKTTLANELVTQLKETGRSVEWFNADIIRTQYNDWDFSIEGRLQQARRMNMYMNSSLLDFVVVDMIAPTKETRNIVNADVVIWLDTIQESRYHGTNVMFERPEFKDVDFRVTEQDAAKNATLILTKLIANTI